MQAEVFLMAYPRTVFPQIHSITDDGLRFKHLYNVDIYPYVAILDPRTGINKLLHTLIAYVCNVLYFIMTNLCYNILYLKTFFFLKENKCCIGVS